MIENTNIELLQGKIYSKYWKFNCPTPQQQDMLQRSSVPANWAKTSRVHMNLQNVPIIKYNVKAFVLASITNLFYIELSIFMDIIAKEVRILGI